MPVGKVRRSTTGEICPCLWGSGCLQCAQMTSAGSATGVPQFGQARAVPSRLTCSCMSVGAVAWSSSCASDLGRLAPQVTPLQSATHMPVAVSHF